MMPNRQVHTTLAKSWKPEVIADGSGNWVGNALRFATEQEALDYVKDLWSRWTSVRKTRVVQVEEPVSHVWLAGQTWSVEDYAKREVK